MRVPLTVVSPGVHLARPIYGVMGQILLKEGVQLTVSLIRRLQELGVAEVHIEAGIPEDEEPISVETRTRAHQMLAQFRANPAGEVPIHRLVEGILEDILACRGIVENVGSISTYDGYTYCHSVDVCVLGVGIGTKLGLTRQDLIDLGTGCLLHDIGKLKVPQGILNKPGPLLPEEYEVIKTHSRLGYDLVARNPNVSTRAAQTVLQHHERWDGTGYPEGLEGNKIHLFAAICGVADTYTAMTSNRVYRRAIPSHESYEMLLAAGGTWFDFRIIQAFARCVVPYPKGILVELTDGRAAQVVRNNTAHPYVPVVRVLDSDGALSEEIDLQLARVGIKGVLGPEAARELLNGIRAGASIA